MIKTESPNRSWKASSLKERDPLKVGYYLIEYVPTGVYVGGLSSDLTLDVVAYLQELYGGNCKVKRMAENVQREYDLMVHEYPTKTVKQAERGFKDLITPLKEKGLFLGVLPERKVPCQAKAKSKPAPCVPQLTTKSSRTKSASTKTLPKSSLLQTKKLPAPTKRNLSK